MYFRRCRFHFVPVHVRHQLSLTEPHHRNFFPLDQRAILRPLGLSAEMQFISQRL